jgi:pimeloyl-ACP methyl ester carboxylesterase
MWIATLLLTPLTPLSADPYKRVGHLQLAPCPTGNGLCGNLLRPLDPTGKVPGSVVIAFEFFAHRNKSVPARGTIVGVEGGPGFSTANARRLHLGLFEPLLDTRDLLLVDNRGTGRSGAIDCEPLQSMVGQTAEAVGACGLSLGDAAGLYGTGLAADDLAAVLDALGIVKVDLYGDSYGTFFGQTFAVRHPDRLRSLVLDGAYPIINGDPFWRFAAPAIRRNLDLICQRAPRCNQLPGSSLERINRLLDRLRAHPVTGQAHTVGGSVMTVTADAPAIGTILFDGASGGLNDRELDPAARAFLDGDDPAPLLRLVAENLWLQGDGRPGGPSDIFSRGLNAAVSCLDYPQIYDMTTSPAKRRALVAARIAAKEASDSAVLYAPLTIAEFRRLPLDLSMLGLCMDWPLPIRPYPPGHPVSEEGSFPPVPTLVLSGELDGLTTPEEGELVARQFPHATHVIVANSFHVVALGDVNGCASELVRTFIANLDPGSMSCASRIRPTRMPPPFPRHSAEVPPVLPRAGNAASDASLALAAAAVQTAADTLARWQISRNGQGAGLRGGSFRTGAAGTNAAVRLDRVRWTEDLAVSGLLIWDRESASISGTLTLEASGGHGGTMEVNWSGRGAGWGLLTGTIDGKALVADYDAPSPTTPGLVEPH